jgi:hypothetical protein
LWCGGATERELKGRLISSRCDVKRQYTSGCIEFQFVSRFEWPGPVHVAMRLVFPAEGEINLIVD